MKFSVFSFLLLIFPILAACQQISSKDSTLKDNQLLSKVDNDSSEISLLFLGDIMTHQLQFESALNEKTGKYDFSSQFEYIKPIIKDVDIALGNLEITFAGPPYSGYPSFSSPDQLAFDIKNAGINYLVTANNHINDKGLEGFTRTIQILDSAGFQHTGSFNNMNEMKRRHPLVINEKGWKIALFNYTYGVNGETYSSQMIVNEIDSLQIKNDLLDAKKQSFDAIVVFFHWGTEYQRKSNADQQKLARLCFENGANAVIGSHPHVIQEMENYNFIMPDGSKKEVIVAYSLGNFVSNYGNWRYADGGALIRFSFKKSQKNEIEITNQGYYLVWVYRKEKTEKLKTFYVIPVSQFENDLTLGKDNIKQMKTFISDSRLLLNQNNKNVKEYKFNPSTKKWSVGSK